MGANALYFFKILGLENRKGFKEAMI